MHRRNFLKTSAAASLTPLFASAALSQGQPAQVKTFPPEKITVIRDRIKPITKEEHIARQQQARKLMSELGIDALFFEGGTSLSYFTGIGWGRSERLFAMILPKNGEPQYVVPKFEEARAAEQVGSARLLTWEEDESPYAMLRIASPGKSDRQSW